MVVLVTKALAYSHSLHRRLIYLQECYQSDSGGHPRRRHLLASISLFPFQGTTTAGTNLQGRLAVELISAEIHSKRRISIA